MTSRTPDTALLPAANASRFPTSAAVFLTGSSASPEDLPTPPPVMMIGGGEFQNLGTELRKGGLNVIVREHPDQALAAAPQAGAGLFVVEFAPRGTTAVALCRRIRSAMSTPDVPILLAGSPAGFDYRELVLASGCDDYLLAPFDTADAVFRVTTMLRRVRLEAGLKTNRDALRSNNDRLQQQLGHSASELLAYARDINKLHRIERQQRVERERIEEHLVRADKMETVGRLAAGVAHEVKNPLAIMLQCINFLERRLEIRDEDTGMALSFMNQAVQKADDIVKGLLDFSHQSALQRKPADINQILKATLLLVKHNCAKHRVRIVKDLTPGLPEVLVDHNRVDQVLVNVFLNAVAVMPDGGDLRVRTGLGHFSPLAEKHPGSPCVEITIADTGPGIAPENLDKVFDPFFTTMRGRGGTGLGLTVARKIMSLHNGEIDIHNKPEGGAIVTLRFEEEGHEKDARTGN